VKISKSYKLLEFLDWTRRKLYAVLALAIIPVVVYQVLDQKWIQAHDCSMGSMAKEAVGCHAGIRVDSAFPRRAETPCEVRRAEERRAEC
jgi:hypothetical protein